MYRWRRKSLLCEERDRFSTTTKNVAEPTGWFIRDIAHVSLRRLWGRFMKYSAPNIWPCCHQLLITPLFSIPLVNTSSLSIDFLVEVIVIAVKLNVIPTQRYVYKGLL